MFSVCLFFSSRRRHTRYIGDWSSDVCSSDLRELVDEMVLADTDAMCAAIKDVFEDTRVVLEPAGALAIAGAKAWVERHGARGKIGRASCRERGESAGTTGCLKKD